MLKKSLALLLALLASLLLATAAFADDTSAEEEADPTTGNVLVIKNLDTGDNLKFESGDSRSFQAGICARLMTALVAYEQVKDLETKLSVPFCASDTSLRGLGSYMGFSYKEENAPMTLRELLSAATVSSATDACLVLAVGTMRHLAGEKTDLSGNYSAAAAASTSEKGYINDFVALMNEKAVALGMKNTLFVNCTGVTATDSRTTAEDMALLAAEICTNATELFEISSKPSYTIGGGNAIYTKNALVNGFNLKGYTLEDAKGMIVGYMEAPDAFCVITTAEKNGLSYVFVCINTTAKSADVPSDTKTYVAEDSAYKTIHSFLPWALKAFKYITVLGVDSDNPESYYAVASVPVKSGKNSSEVTIVTERNVELLVTKDIVPDTDIRIELPDFAGMELTAPVSKGQIVGTARVYLKGELVDEVSLVTNDGVEESTALAAVDKAKTFLTGPLMMKIYKWALILGIAYLVFALGLFIYRIVRKYISAGKGD